TCSFCLPGALRDLPTVPTRRSSDLRRCEWTRQHLLSETSQPSGPSSRRCWRWRVCRPPRKPCRVICTGRSCGCCGRRRQRRGGRSEEHTSELQSRENLVCRLLLEKK